jgi:hypothetical protein
MNFFLKRASPISSKIIKQHFDNHRFNRSDLQAYITTWKTWLTDSKLKCLQGLDQFEFADYSQGTSQVFDQYVLRHGHHRIIACFRGDFQYHACISKHQRFQLLDQIDQLDNKHSLLISLPFSGTGSPHCDFESILNRCDQMNIPVCIDLAYWGIAKNCSINVAAHPSVQEITASLSKPFWTLGPHRVGVRFSRLYLDDGISMINETEMQNFYSMSLGMHYMKSFDADWNWRQYQDRYLEICQQHDLNITNTVIFGISNNDRYRDFNRGQPGINRVCLSQLLE